MTTLHQDPPRLPRPARAARSTIGQSLLRLHLRLDARAEIRGPHFVQNKAAAEWQLQTRRSVPNWDAVLEAIDEEWAFYGATSSS